MDINKKTCQQNDKYRKTKTNKTRFRNKLVVLLFITFLSFEIARTASAAEETIILEPPFQEITLKSNTGEITAKIKITNNTQNNLDFYFQILEIKQLDEQGNIGFINKPSTGENPLAWFIEEPESISIDSKNTTEIELKIKNSIELSPGGHYVALVAKVNAEQDYQNTQVSPAISSFLLIKKEGGEVYQLSLKDLEKINWYTNKLPENLKVTFENQGNVHITPKGTVEIKDIFGRLVRKGIVNEQSSIILPKSRRTLEIKTYVVSYNFPIMLNTVTVKGDSTAGDTAFQQSYSFIYIDKKMYLLVALIIGLLVVKVVKRYARK